MIFEICHNELELHFSAKLLYNIVHPCKIFFTTITVTNQSISHACSDIIIFQYVIFIMHCTSSGCSGDELITISVTTAEG